MTGPEPVDQELDVEPECDEVPKLTAEEWQAVAALSAEDAD